MSVEPEVERIRSKDAPLAAIFCYLAAGLTALWGIAVWLSVRAGQYDGAFNVWWGVVYLAGAFTTTLLGTASLVRREDWKLWTITSVLLVLLPLAFR